MKSALLKRESLIRILADSLMLNVSLFVAFFLRFLYFVTVGVRNPITLVPVVETLRTSAWAYAHSSLFLTPLALVIFYYSGFYTHGRAYRGRYKAIIVVQAVSLVYVLFALLVYLRLLPDVPRGVLVGGWLLALVLIGGARLFSMLWAEVVRREDRLSREGFHGPSRHVLVIGGAGYVGSTLVRQLLRSGYIVRVLDVLLYGDQAMAELRGHPRLEFFAGDFRNVETVVRSMQDVDAAVHLGGIVGDPASDIDREITHEVNVAATRLIAEVARGYGVRRFIFTSTCSVYGANKQMLDERSAVSPASAYAKSKLASERLLLDLADGRFAPVILRFGTLYGLSYRPRFDLVVNLLVAKALFERQVVIAGGEQWRPFLHVEDAARAIGYCLQVPLASVAGQIFNVGGTVENYRLKDVAKIVTELIPGTNVIFLNPETGSPSYHVSFEKVRQRLSFQPTKTVRDGILEIKEAIERGEIKDYSVKEYSNFKFLSEATLSKGIMAQYPRTRADE